MKRKYLIGRMAFIGIFTTLFSLSCTDLDEEVFDQVTSDNFFNTEEEFVAALGAGYTGLYGLMTNANVYSLQEVTSDEMAVPTRGADWDDGGNWRRLHTHGYTLDDDRIRDGWNFCFGGISTCNRLIAQFEEIPSDNSAAFIAELKGLRGLYYYWLLDLYGNVPIVTGFADADPNPSTRPRTEVYNFLEQELTAIAGDLTQTVGGAAYARVNYYTVQAILAKLYLNAAVYKGSPEWAKASAACDEIINSGRFSLASNYSDNFIAENQGSPEFIFAIPYDEVFATGFNLAQMTLHYGSQGTFNLQEQPWNGFCTLEEFYNSYEDGDLRKANNFIVGPQFTSTGAPVVDGAAEADDPDGPELNFTPEISSLGRALRQQGARVGKFQFETGAQQSLNNDFAIFRYSDILLMKAEAEFRLGNTGVALSLVNQIRERAGVAPFTTLTEDNLLAERGREMFSETWRRSDLIRFGKYNDPWWEKPATDPHVNIFPVPRSQLDANPNLQQNPGY